MEQGDALDVVYLCVHSLPLDFSQGFFVEVFAQHHEMASLQAFDGGHSGLAVEECQFTKGSTSLKSSNVYETRVNDVDGIRENTFCIKLEGVVMDCFDSEG